MADAEEPWVGTWRPHKRRGDIAAMYGSPGPKYGLPGLTGEIKHDPTMYKAPAYSMASRHSEIKAQGSPGPKYSIPANFTRTGKDGTPAFSLYGRLQDRERSMGPGPGQYAPEQTVKAAFPTAPAYSLTGRSKDSAKAQTPGPAAYSLPPVLGSKTVTTTSAPASSFGRRSKGGGFADDLTNTPGPAAYNPVNPSSYKSKPPQYSLYGRDYARRDGLMIPGPGAHYPEQVTVTKSKAPSFSFGVRHSQYTAPLIEKEDE
ncbi:unnamed protein product [Ophioblennius macclurei]